MPLKLRFFSEVNVLFYDLHIANLFIDIAIRFSRNCLIFASGSNPFFVFRLPVRPACITARVVAKVGSFKTSVSMK